MANFSAHAKGHIRHKQAFHSRIGRAMDEHDRFVHRSRLFGIIDKGLIILKGQPHAANDDHIGIGLIGNPHQKCIIGLPGNGKNRNFLRLDKAVEDIDHRNIGPHHFAWDDPLDRIEGGASDIDRFSQRCLARHRWALLRRSNVCPTRHRHRSPASAVSERSLCHLWKSRAYFEKPASVT